MPRTHRGTLVGTLEVIWKADFIGNNNFSEICLSEIIFNLFPGSFGSNAIGLFGCSGQNQRTESDGDGSGTNISRCCKVRCWKKVYFENSDLILLLTFRLQWTFNSGLDHP